jgi:hypothetical protein
MRLRSLFATALIAVAAFVLGLAAAPAPAKPPGLDWKNDGKYLTVTNAAPAPYLVEVRLKKGAPALSPPLPVRAIGGVRVPLRNVDSINLYRIEAVAMCSGNGCRPCDTIGGGDCPAPPRPPFTTQDSLATLHARP